MSRLQRYNRQKVVDLRFPSKLRRYSSHFRAYSSSIARDKLTWWGGTENAASNSVVIDPIRVQLRPKSCVLGVKFGGGKPVKPTASTGVMERAMGIEPTSEVWEA